MKAPIRHALTLYEELQKGAKREEIDGTPMLVFRGSVTDAFASTGISRTYYTPCFQSLVDSGCISQMQRGSRTQTTIIVLHDPPREETFVASRNESPGRPSYALLSQRLRNIETAIGGLNITQALVELQDQITLLNGRVADLENTGGTK